MRNAAVLVCPKPEGQVMLRGNDRADGDIDRIDPCRHGGLKCDVGEYAEKKCQEGGSCAGTGLGQDVRYIHRWCVFEGRGETVGSGQGKMQVLSVILVLSSETRVMSEDKNEGLSTEGAAIDSLGDGRICGDGLSKTR